MTLQPLTERQEQILDVVRWHTSEHGYPPTIRQIATVCGLRSAQTVHAHLQVLQRHGKLQVRPRGGAYWPTTPERTP